MFKKHFDAADLLADGAEGHFVRLPDNIPALPSNLHGKVMRADRLARLSTRIIPLLDMADVYHEASRNESAMARIRALPVAVREAHLHTRNHIENGARRIEQVAHAYFLAVVNARYVA